MMARYVHTTMTPTDDFLSLPERVYRDDSSYQPACVESTRFGLQRAKFAGRQFLLTTHDQDGCAGRVVARLSESLRDDKGRPMGMLGYFEALDRPAPVRRMLNAAFDWFRQRDVRTVIGPIDGDTWHSYRMNVGPFDAPSFPLEPYNPPHYESLWRDSRFRPLHNYFSNTTRHLPEILESRRRIDVRLQARGYTTRELNVDRIDDELDTIYELACDVFSSSPLFELISREEFQRLYGTRIRQFDPRLTLFSMGPDGHTNGFVLANRSHGDIVNVKTLGVTGNCRAMGVGFLLGSSLVRNALAIGCQRMNVCLYHEGNASARMDGRSTVFRQYVLMGRQIGSGSRNER